jgi:hypothetical protein
MADDRTQRRGAGSPRHGGLFAGVVTFFFGQTQSPEQSAANQGWIVVLVGTAVGGLVLVGFVASDLRGFAAGCLLALASALVGSLIGFLFGLPRSRTEAVTEDGGGDGNKDSEAMSAEARPAGYRANTNLEDISDWLTKILVGVGLTQLGSIPAGFQSLVGTVKVALGAGDDTAPIAGSVIVGYLLIGFLATYLWARTRLGRALQLADQDSTARLRRVENSVNELRTTIASANAAANPDRNP